MDLSNLENAISNNLTIVVLMWNMIINNFILAIPVLIMLIYAVVAAVHKLKKVFE